MLRYSFRIFREDLRKWIPTVVVVAVMTCLMGVMTSAYLFALNPEVTDRAALSAMERADIKILSQTLSIVVALLAIFALAAVGSGTINAVRDTFGMWRLVGAGPACVRQGATGVAAITAAAGAVAGGVASFPISYFLMPLLVQMVIPRMAGIKLMPSPAAPILTIVLGFAICMCGAVETIRQVGKVKPLEALRRSEAPTRRYLSRMVAGSLFLLVGFALAASAFLLGRGTPGGIGALFNLAVNAGLCSMVAVYLMGPRLLSHVLRLVSARALAWGGIQLSIAAQSARARADESSDTIAPLSAGIAGSGVTVISVLACTESARRVGYTGVVNYVDTVAILLLVSVAALLTSGAILGLSYNAVQREITLFRLAGMSPRAVAVWLLEQSLVLAMCSAGMALIPLAVSCFTAAVGSQSLTGQAVVTFPWLVVAGSVPVISAALFLVLWLPSRSTLRKDVARGLRG